MSVMSVMSDVVVGGAAMTPFGKFPDMSVRRLAQQAVRAALSDAGCDTRDVGMVFFANATDGLLTGQEMIRGQVALRDTGLLGVPIVNVENACASASSAVHLAGMAIRSGQCDVALAVGSEKLTHPEKQRSFAAIGTAIDLERRAELVRRLGIEADPDAGDGSGRSLFMDIYADSARKYMTASGATERDFAAVAVKNHEHGARNPNAQYRNLVTVDEVLSSRRISGPLTLLMCSPIGDGAAALVLCSSEFAARRGLPRITVAGSALVSGRDDRGESATERAAAGAYEQAALGPEDVHVVELHDAAAPAELIIYEQLGLCGTGDGPKHLASGRPMLGGAQPVNPSGGLISKGHPVGATGCAQLVELIEQLREDAGDRQVAGARVGLAHNAGGHLEHDNAVACVTILQRHDR